MESPSLLPPHASFLSGRAASSLLRKPFIGLTRPDCRRFRCSAGQAGLFSRFGRLIKEKTKSDVEKIFSGFTKTRDNLAVIDALLLYWNLSETDRVLNKLDEALLVADFGPKITFRIANELREDILAGKLKSGSEIKVDVYVFHRY